MNNSQTGFGLILLIIGLALIGVIFAFYFTRDGDEQQSQYETGQAAIEQARQINQGSQQTKQLEEQLELQNNLNSN